MSEPFKIYGGTAQVVAVRRKSKKKKVVNKSGYTRKYPKKLKSGKIVWVPRHIGPYPRSLAGTIRKLKIVKRGK